MCLLCLCVFQCVCGFDRDLLRDVLFLVIVVFLCSCVLFHMCLCVVRVICWWCCIGCFEVLFVCVCLLKGGCALLVAYCMVLYGVCVFAMLCSCVWFV